MRWYGVITLCLLLSLVSVADAVHISQPGSNSAAPGPIGSTTSSTGQFTSLCTGTSPCTLPGNSGALWLDQIANSGGNGAFIDAISVGNVALWLGTSSTGATAYVLSQGTNGTLLHSISGQSINVTTQAGGDAVNLQNAGVTKFTAGFSGTFYPSDNAVNSVQRGFMNFAIAQTAITTATNLGCTKLVKAETIENDVGSWYIGAACAAPVIRTYDCGSSAPTNANCSGGTQLTTNTLSGTAGTATNGTINQASVAAGEYVCAQVQAAGSCTTLFGAENLEVRPQ